MDTKATELSVYVVDDDEQFCRHIKLGLERDPRYRVNYCHSGAEALQRIPPAQPHVVLMDVVMPKMSGIECTRLLRTDMPELRILMMTGGACEDHLREALQAGICGFLAKPFGLHKCRQAIDEVLGQSVLFSEMKRVMTAPGNSQLPDNSRGKIVPLTASETKIMVYLVRHPHMIYKDIASGLNLSPETVHTHLNDIFRKYGVHKREEAIQIFLSQHPQLPD